MGTGGRGRGRTVGCEKAVDVAVAVAVAAAVAAAAVAVAVAVVVVAVAVGVAVVVGDAVVVAGTVPGTRYHVYTFRKMNKLLQLAAISTFFRAVLNLEKITSKKENLSVACCEVFFHGSPRERFWMLGIFPAGTGFHGNPFRRNKP